MNRWLMMFRDQLQTDCVVNQTSGPAEHLLGRGGLMLHDYKYGNKTVFQKIFSYIYDTHVK